ncbi:MAG: efflux RND transporter periplasmic adaptor subunit [Herbaspirillum sp.]
MLKKRWLWILVVAIAAIVVAALLISTVTKKRSTSNSATATASQPATASLEFLPGDLIRVGNSDLRETMALTGSLRAVNKVAIKARVSAQIDQVLVREGEAVSAGQLLIKMDSTEYRARVDQAQGALVAARGQLAIAARSRDANQALLSRGFISKNANSTTTSQYEIALANVNSAQGALDAARKSQNDTFIRAPMSGLISSRTVQPGEKVSADNHLLDIVDLRQLEMEAAVPAEDILRIALGQSVQISVEGMGGEQSIVGTVVRINPATQAGSRSILTYIRVDNADQRLRDGMFAEAQLTLAQKKQVLTVPQSALQMVAGQPTVYAVEDAVLKQKIVRVGVRGRTDAGPAVEIISGLTNGAQIVKTNLGDLPIGSKVRITSTAPASTNANPSATTSAPVVSGN